MRKPRSLQRLCALTCGSALLIGLIACKADKILPATQVVVTINSNLAIGEQLSRVDVEVRDAAGKHVVGQQTFALTKGKPRVGEVRVPFSFTVAKGKADRFRLDVIGYGPLGPGGALRSVIERKAIAGFRTHETLLLKVFLGDVCFDNVCVGERTCFPEADADTAAGECGPAQEAPLEQVEPGHEGDVWSGEPSAHDAGAHDAGHATDDASAPSDDAGERDAGATPNDAGERDAGAGGTGGSDAPDSGGSAGTDASGSGGSDSGGTGGTGGSAGSSAPVCVPIGEQMFTPMAADHVQTPEPPGFYNSVPPSSGSHCDSYGHYTEYTPQRPLPACYFVHNLEHAGIVFLYNCPSGCSDVVDLLRQVVNDAGADPDCPSVKRLLITPYADMNVKLAAVSWGFTWTSNCIDDTTYDSLLAFVHTHWGTIPNGGAGVAPEPTQCVDGSINP